MTNWSKLRSEVPRPFEVVARDVKAEGKPGRKRVRPEEVSRRLEPLMELVASGQVPMDKNTAHAVAAYIDGRKEDK